ncbi:hypothetical protein ABPG72_019633 [Tetrahymena utriculariae]
MESQNNNQNESFNCLKYIQKGLVIDNFCIISLIFLIIGLTQCTLNKQFLDFGNYLSMSFWGVLGYYFICKTQASTSIQRSQFLKEEIHKINASFLFCNYSFMLPMFFIYEMALSEKKNLLSFEVLFRQTSFYLSSLFYFQKQQQVGMLINSVKNHSIKQTLYGLNIIISFLIISSFLFCTSNESINHKFIYSQFPFSLIFIGIQTCKNFKKYGIFLHVAYSIFQLLVSFQEINSDKNIPLVKQGYLFSIILQAATLIFLIYSIMQNIIKNKKRVDSQIIQSQEQDNTTNQANTSQEYFQINISQPNQLIQETTNEIEQYQIAYNITLEEIEKIICTKNYVSEGQQIIYSQTQNQQNQLSNNTSQCRDCPICQQDFQNEEKVYTLSCKHQYHATCLIEWIKMQNTCPLCRTFIISSQWLQILKNQTQNANDQKQRSLLLIP